MSWEFQKSFGGYADYVVGLAFPPGDSGYLAAASQDGNVVDVYDRDTHSVQTTIGLSGIPRNSREETIQFSNDGSWLFISLDGGDVEVIDSSASDPSNWTVDRQISAGSYTYGVDTSPVDTHVAVGHGSGVDVYDYTTDSLVTSLSTIGSSGYSPRWSPEGEVMAYGDSDGNVHVADVSTWEDVMTASDATSNTGGFAWSDPDWLAHGSWDNSVYIYDYGSVDGSGWELLTSVSGAGSAYGITFSDNYSASHLVYGEGNGGSNVDFYNTGDWSLDTTFTEPTNSVETAASDEDSYVYIGDRDGGIYYYSKEGVVSGTVTIDGTVVEGATVTAINEQDSSVRDVTTTGTDGYYELSIPKNITVHVIFEYEDADGQYHSESLPYVQPV